MPSFSFTIPSPVTFDGDQSDWEQAIRAWVAVSTGLDDQHIIRAEQNGPRPSAPFAEVRVGGIIPLGAVDASVEEFNSGAPVGEEITRSAHGQREFSATVRVFTESAIGSDCARAILTRVQTALGLEEMRDILYGYGVTVFDNGKIDHIPAILDTKWEGRATLTIGCYAEQVATTKTGYIKTVVLTNQIPEPDTTLTVQIP